MRFSPPALRWLVSTGLILACHAPPRAPPDGVDSLIAPGETLYLRGQYDSAAQAWNAALARPGIVGSPSEASLLHWKGLAAWRLGDYADARVLGERALALKRRWSASPSDIAESQNALGLLAWNQGRLQDATVLLRESLDGFERDRDRAGVAKASNNLALVFVELGRFGEAREKFGIARVSGRAVGNLRIEGRATTNLAMIELWTGDPAAAPELLAESRRLADSARDPVGLENSLGQLAVAWNLLGQPGRALATLDSAVVIARQHELAEEEANNLMVAASIHREAGDAERALQLYRQARGINEKLGLEIETGMVLRSEAALLAARGATAPARTSMLEALRIHRAANARLEEFQDLLLLASLGDESGDRAAAARYRTEARGVSAELESPQVRVALAVAEAHAADRRADPGGVLASLRPITGDLELAAAGARVDVEWLRARSFAALGNLDSAVASGRRAVRAIERGAESFASSLLRSGATAERGEVFADLVLVLLRLGQTGEAFAVADAARGRALLDHLAGAREAVQGSPMGRDLAERDRLLRSIDALLGKLEEVQTRPRQERGPDTEAIGRELADRLRQTRAEFEGVMIRLARRDAARAGLIGTGAASLDSIRAVLGPEEVLIQYLVTPDRLITFAVTREQVRTLVSPVPREELENRVRLARGIISTPNSRDTARTVLEDLHRILVGPVQETGLLPPGRRLVIVPHGALSYLPFAALRDPASETWLAQHHSLQYLPTASGLAALRAVRFPHESGRLAVLSPLPGQLPASAAEATAVASATPRSRRFIGAAATESVLRRTLAGGDRVHVATHGIMNPLNPMFSSIRLARGSQSPDDNGRLEVYELLGMTIRSPLVFLSGCETGLGSARLTRFDRGADYATLSQAFLFAGARGVIATLWRIDDEGAAVFADRFYRSLQTSPAVDAVATAQRQLMADPRWGHPYYWAGYTMAGDGPLHGVANRVTASVSQ